MKRITLYECAHARVNGDRIGCHKGYRLSSRTEDGSIEVKRLARGEALALAPCQKCPDFDCVGPPVPPEERGWLRKKGARW